MNRRTMKDAYKEAMNAAQMRGEAEEGAEETNPQEAAPEGEGGEAEGETTPQSASQTAPLTQGSQEEGEGETAPLTQGSREEAEALREEIKRLTEENEDLKKAIAQSGEKAAEKIASLAEAPEGAEETTRKEDLGSEYPDIDFSAIMYGTPEDAKNAKDKFVREMLALVEKDAQPTLSKYGEAKKAMAREDAAAVVAAMEEMKGFSDIRGELDRMIAQNAMLSANENPIEQYITAYLIRRGTEAMAKDGCEPEVKELMELYHKNESFRNAIEEERLEALRSQADVPPTPAGGGLSSAEPYTPSTPKTMAEARKNIRKMYKK